MNKLNRLLITIIALSLTLSLVLSGCASKSSNETATSDMTMEYAGESVEEAKEMETSESPAAMPMDPASADAINMDDGSTSSSETSTNTSLQATADNRKYIRTFDFQIETLKFDDSRFALEKLVDNYFGFFQSTEVTGRTIGYDNSISRQGIYTVRVPKEKVGDFLQGLAGIGNVLDSSSYVEDVTNQYVDLEARIKTLRVQEERLLAILEDADELQYILELERELSSVRYEIESYMTSFRDLDNRINYSTVYIKLYEVFVQTELKLPPTTFFEKIQDGFSQSLTGVLNFLQNLVIFLISNIPGFILFAVIIGIIYGFIRLMLRTKLFKKIFMLDSNKKTTPSTIDLIKSKDTENRDKK